MCVHTILHRTDLIIFPLALQTITTAPMMSIWGKWGPAGVSWRVKNIINLLVTAEDQNSYLLAGFPSNSVETSTRREFTISLKTNHILEMWANVQRDGRPAEHRWRPLFNAAKFGWQPLLECRAVRCQDVKAVEICTGAPNSPMDLSR